MTRKFTSKLDFSSESALSLDKALRRQKHLPKILHTGLQAICQAGGVGRVEMITFFALRDEEDRVQSGMYVLDSYTLIITR